MAPKSPQKLPRPRPTPPQLKLENHHPARSAMLPHERPVVASGPLPGLAGHPRLVDPEVAPRLRIAPHRPHRRDQQAPRVHGRRGSRSAACGGSTPPVRLQEAGSAAAWTPLCSGLCDDLPPRCWMWRVWPAESNRALRARNGVCDNQGRGREAKEPGSPEKPAGSASSSRDFGKFGPVRGAEKHAKKSCVLIEGVVIVAL